MQYNIGDRYRSTKKCNPVLLVLCFALLAVGMFVVDYLLVVAGQAIPSWIFRYLMVIGSANLVRIGARSAIAGSRTRGVGIARIAILVTALVIAHVNLAMFFGGALVYENIGASLNDPVFFFRIATGCLNPAVMLTVWKHMVSLGEYGVMILIYVLLNYLLGILIPLGAAGRARMPFHEERRKWMYPAYSVGRLDYFDPARRDELEQALASGNIQPLLDCVPHRRFGDNQYAQLVFYKISGRHTGFVAIENLTGKRIQQKKSMDRSYRQVYFVAPYQVGEDKALQLEQHVNTYSRPLEPALVPPVPQTPYPPYTEQVAPPPMPPTQPAPWAVPPAEPQVQTEYQAWQPREDDRFSPDPSRYGVGADIQQEPAEEKRDWDPEIK